MTIAPDIDRALELVRVQICPHCHWASRCVDSDRCPGQGSRCTIFRHLPNLMRIAASRDTMLDSLPEVIAAEIRDRHEDFRTRGGDTKAHAPAFPDTLYHFRAEVSRILTPILRRRLHERLLKARLLMRLGEQHGDGLGVGRAAALPPSETFLG